MTHFFGKEASLIDPDFDEQPGMAELLEGIAHGHLNAKQEGPEFTIWCKFYDRGYREPRHSLPVPDISSDDLADHIAATVTKLPNEHRQILGIEHEEIAEKRKRTELEKFRDDLIKARDSAPTLEHWTRCDLQLKLLRERLGLSPEDFYSSLMPLSTDQQNKVAPW